MQSVTRTVAARIHRAALAAALLFLSACGSDDDGGSGAPSAPPSRVDESKALGSLTPEEQTTHCEDVAAWMALTQEASYVEGFCLHSAIASASLNASVQQLTLEQMRESCRTLQAQCLEQRNMAMPLPTSMGCAYPASCTATVGDSRTCMVGTYEAWLGVFASLPSCDAMQTDTVSQIDTSAVTNPAMACARVLACGPPQ